ncbi:metallophosphoesterase [Acetonema longum]|uniref:Phosphoesterase n=1 Tax=Acetonema longum DSM 6540 TaxID=1009370 RepID=F7NEL0_9FIRM|nr:metallophosphoesterase [Acetonema longum]EGO65421.1 phosphodiesterase, MJ0936 family protein [Acetonema longum DSM 6540]
MKIGVMSDSHGDKDAIRQAAARAGQVDLWLHAGDYCQDAVFLGRIASVPVITVAGNCDGSAQVRPDEFMNALDKKIWLTHGHRYKVKQNQDELIWWAGQYGVDIVVYGHTHVADILRQDQVLAFNPGSVAFPRVGSPSFGLIEIVFGDKAEAQIVYLKGR